ncbi:uncharacterized protein DEA37_0010725 [Paragonimus westermani]|uniref:SHSP domain-containing protein n=1 Tax=Paragonimus westermani TaxID=34504 RepID=A0A5J4NWW8_9TREM|nr:uncharacterized protein DEA37_0010725 [Paragonimus westermani]
MSDWDGRKVPIQRDSRTFEQRRRDLLVKLHQSFGCRSNLNTNDELDEVNSPIYECYQPQHPPNWFEDLNQWVDAMQKDWDREIQRIRNDMFQLLPVDWVNEDADELTQHEDVPSILDRMEREMEMMRHHTGSTSNVERKHRKLCGVGDRGPEEDASVPYLSGGPLDYLKDVYEVDENGQIRFIVRFDVVGYGPEDIQVNTSSHGLTVHAKKSLQNETETNTQEYIRTVYLPSSIDKNHFVGHLSEVNRTSWFIFT